jgi:hypothetical protein
MRRRQQGGAANGNQQQLQRSRSQQQQQRSRSRPRSRVRLNRNNFNQNQNAFKRSNSINARLGNNGPAQIRRRQRLTSNSQQLNRPMTGRIIKRTQKKAVGARVQRNIRNGVANGGNNRRGGRVVKRWIRIT